MSNGLSFKDYPTSFSLTNYLGNVREVMDCWLHFYLDRDDDTLQFEEQINYGGTKRSLDLN